jgi:signal transduction histidine kinase
MRSAILGTKPAVHEHESGKGIAPMDPEQNANPRKAGTFFNTFLRRLSSLKAKLIIPYLILTLLTAMVGTFVVTRLVASSVRERFYNQMYEASRVAADGIVRIEDEHLINLRLMAFTEGVAEAFSNQEADSLQEILWPLLLNNEIEALSTVDLNGREILTLALDHETNRYNIFKGTDFGDFEIVSKVLNNEPDELGDKFAGLVKTQFGPYLYTSAPVRDEMHNLVGVIMIGTQLESLLGQLKSQSLADIILLDSSGKLLASTFVNDIDMYEKLELEAEFIPSGDEVYNSNFKVDETDRSYQAIYSPVVIRQMDMGVLGIALPSNYIVYTEATSRNTFSVIFSIATLSVIVLGYVLSQSIARPILKLRSVTTAVAQGDLNQTSGFKRSDEIGDLASVFDLMTYRLRHRTAQAARLYQETLLRNEDLARANSRLQEAQQQLIQSGKLAAVGELTAGIVHDVKNPLAVIKGLAEELQEEPGLTPDVTKQLGAIRESATRATQIVSDLLKFARQSTPEMRRQNINETIRAAVRLTDYLARKGRVEVSMELLPDPVMIMYDAIQIEQVLVNLIQNGIQAMKDGGKIHIVATRITNGISLQVKDNGAGISEKNLPRIFDPFFTTKSEGEGTGLGLSVSYGIITRHRGSIDVASKVGVGTVFTVRLPNEPSVSTGRGV